MSIFDSTVLDEFTMLDEGEQAEDYKWRKEYNKERQDHKENMRNFRRYEKYGPPGNKADIRAHPDSHFSSNGNKNTKHFDDLEKEDLKRDVDTFKITNKELNNSTGERHNKIYRDQNVVNDATNRHLRRHGKKTPKTESALMLIAGYESEFTY